jgi:hypothetical protein
MPTKLVPFQPRRADVVLDQPAEDGVVLFTKDGRIRVGIGTVEWVSYDTFITVSSMSLFEVMRASGLLKTHCLYCVENLLYRWDGTAVVMVGCHVPDYADAPVGSVLTKTAGGLSWVVTDVGADEGVGWGAWNSLTSWGDGESTIRWGLLPTANWCGCKGLLWNTN